ncbi:MAG TPA: hypothetical protein DE147_10050, partial [Gammaproteobacteria bacterium]|nr:hypothetical protein [Gammaproteobacteria bacterium]
IESDEQRIEFTLAYRTTSILPVLYSVVSTHGFALNLSVAHRLEGRIRILVGATAIAEEQANKHQQIAADITFHYDSRSRR